MQTSRNSEKKRANQALQRTRPSRPGCNPTPSWAGSLSYIGSFGARFDWHMKVRVIVGLAVAVQDKHSQQMRRAASVFTDDERSVEVSHLPEDPNSLIAVFSIPTAAQGGLLDRIEQDLWNCLDDVTGPVVTATSGTLNGRTSRWSERG